MSIVYLIGAGPGDPGLITVRGLQYLATADVVLYDHLVHARLLRSARPDAEQIDVGTAAPQPLEQEAICYLLAEKAREGKIVARLKWGDPFVFDSGGAEALFLHEQGVRFEVVPGIPAGIAVPGYAGIPITYPGRRRHADVRPRPRGRRQGAARRSTGPASRGSTARSSATRARSSCRRCCSALLAHGRSPEDSAAVVYDGTLPTQQTIAGTLAEIAAAVAQAADRRPAILVVGRVVALREHLRWFDARPLFGKRILVTRPRIRRASSSSGSRRWGAEAIEAPMIRIVPPEDYGPLDEACARAGDFDWIVFSSANAVDAFMERLLAGPARSARARRRQAVRRRPGDGRAAGATTG